MDKSNKSNPPLYSLSQLNKDTKNSAFKLVLRYIKADYQTLPKIIFYEKKI